MTQLAWLLLHLVGGRLYFRDFLRSEYSEENFLFWTSCESLKNEQNPDIIEEKARSIYEDYISILSPKEVSDSLNCCEKLIVFFFQVSLDSRVREVINKNMVEPSPHTFDEAQLQIYTLMHRDSYPRFINSQIYRRLLHNEGGSTWPTCAVFVFIPVLPRHRLTLALGHSRSQPNFVCLHDTFRSVDVLLSPRRRRRRTKKR